MDSARYSHRDRRADRAVEAGAAALALAVVVLVGLASVTDGRTEGLLAVFGLAIAGAGFVAYGRRLTDRYVHDLGWVRSEVGGRSALRAEVESDVGLHQRAFRPTSRSPHVRRLGVRPGPASAGSPSSRDGLRVGAQADLQ